MKKINSYTHKRSVQDVINHEKIKSLNYSHRGRKINSEQWQFFKKIQEENFPHSKETWML